MFERSQTTNSNLFCFHLFEFLDDWNSSFGTFIPQLCYIQESNDSGQLEYLIEIFEITPKILSVSINERMAHTHTQIRDEEKEREKKRTLSNGW